MADTISHIIEGYFDGVGGNPISDAIGEGIVRTVLDNDGVLQDLGNIDMRSQIAWASTLAMGGNSGLWEVKLQDGRHTGFSMQ